MCVTCGCSTDAKVVITSLQAGEEISLRKIASQKGKLIDQFHHSHVLPIDVVTPKVVPATIELEQAVLGKNDLIADANRKLFQKEKILALNLMSSPGSGKTTLLERTIRDLKPEIQIDVIEGDQETTNDAERIRATGCRVVQINTGAGCHLEADMLARGLEQLKPSQKSVVMIENVGNLVCPALFDLGEKAKVIIFSVTEGEDKPLKYPHMFKQAKLLILNKIDLLPYLQFDVERCLSYARKVNPEIEVIQLSAFKGDGMKEWYEWIKKEKNLLYE